MAGAKRVVLVTLDTTRADAIGAYGAALSHTPTLDTLAEKGVRFDVAVSPAPLTLVSHASMLTGLEPPRHGVRNNSTFRLSAEVPTVAEHLRAEGIASAAFVAAIVLDRQYGLARGFDVYDDTMSTAERAGQNERTADRVVDAALDWLGTAPDRFFLWVHLFDPHADYDPPPGFKAVFPNDPYAAEVAFSDSQLGRLVKGVEAAFPDGATLFAVTSDHGESRGEHGEVTHSMTLYDATQRVPLVLSGPNWPSGHVVSTPVGVLDLAPTFLAALGVPPIEDLDGLDLQPIAAAGPKTAPDPNEPGSDRAIYIETVATQADFGWSPLLGLRTQQFKYVRAPRPELYDVLADPGEMNDLSRDPAYADVVARLDAELETRLRRTRPSATRIAPDDDTRAQLEALGYMSPRSGAQPIEPSRLGVVGGIDPKDGLPQVTSLLRAMILLGDARPQAALDELSKEEGSSYLLDLYRSKAALRSGKPELAERYARSSVEHSPASLDCRIALGRALEARGQWDEAEEVYILAREVDSSSPDAQIGLGRVAEGRGDLAAARDAYRRAMESRGASVEATWREAAMRIEAGESVEASLDRVPEGVLNRPVVAERLARAESAAGRVEAARARLRRALAAMPNSRLIRRALAELPPPSAR